MSAGLYDGLVVDLFAGGGGASVGIEAAMGRSVDVAVNHDPIAVAMHRANHPHTKHLTTDVFEVDPLKATGGRLVDVLWASPDCTYHSKARGAKPIRSKQAKRRALAWVVVKWAARVRPAVIMLENVEEFADWCPLVPRRHANGKVMKDPDGAVLLRPCERRKGATFRRWVRELRALGYAVEWRELRACDYGSPTIRKRLYVIARCDGQPINWPEKTHGVEDSGSARRRVVQRRGAIRNQGTGEGMASVRETVLDGHADSYRPLLRPYRIAAECIEWSIACPSIFLTREQARALGLKVQRPLKPATMRRIARGVKKYVIDAAKPFVVLLNHGRDDWRGSGIDDPISTISAAGNSHAVVSPCFVPRYGERKGQQPRCASAEQPSPTIVPKGNGAQLVAALCLSQQRGSAKAGGPGDPARPLPTITAGGNHAALVYAFLASYYGVGIGQDVRDPMRTIPTHERFAVVMVDGAPRVIFDIGMRMLTPRELYRCQGFGDEYVIDLVHEGKRLTKGQQTRLVGNSVCPQVAEALVRANVAMSPTWRQRERTSRRKAVAPC